MKNKILVTMVLILVCALTYSNVRAAAPQAQKKIVVIHGDLSDTHQRILSDFIKKNVDPGLMVQFNNFNKEMNIALDNANAVLFAAAPTGSRLGESQTRLLERLEFLRTIPSKAFVWLKYGEGDLRDERNPLIALLPNFYTVNYMSTTGIILDSRAQKFVQWLKDELQKSPATYLPQQIPSGPIHTGPVVMPYVPKTPVTPPAFTALTPEIMKTLTEAQLQSLPDQMIESYWNSKIKQYGRFHPDFQRIEKELKRRGVRIGY